MFKQKVNIWKLVKGLSLAVLVAVSVAFSEYHQNEQVFGEIIVKFEKNTPTSFLTKEDVKQLVREFIGTSLEGGKLIHIDSKQMEIHLKNNKFVKGVEVVKNLNGNIAIRITQEQPIARFFSSDSSYYVTEERHVVPLSSHHSERLMVVLGKGVDQLFIEDSANTQVENKLMEVVNYIHQDPFWNAMIATAQLDSNNNLTLYPQVTKAKIEFGSCGNYVDKFEKLKLFYEKVLPTKGWKSYKRVNVEFEDQLICE